MGQSQPRCEYSIPESLIRSNLSQAFAVQDQFTDLSLLAPRLPQVELAPYEEGKFELIQDKEKLEKVVTELEKEECLGLDLENHYRYSYNGFLCLIQITTVNYSTYLIDPLKIDRQFISATLGLRVLQNHQITKVLHGCLFSDLGWVQRDFGVQVLNVIDTQDLYRQLDENKRTKKVKCGTIVSLAQLWKELCKELNGISKEEKEHFQHADWSERPLNQKMMDYAAHDSHFMMYIANELRKQFEKEEQFLETVRKFNEKVLQTKFVLRVDAFKPESYRQLIIKKLNVKYDPEDDNFLQTDHTLSVLYKIREEMGSQLDMSPETLISNPFLLAIASKRLNSKEQLLELGDTMGLSQRQIDTLSEQAPIFLKAIEQSIASFPESRPALFSYYNEKSIQNEKSSRKKEAHNPPVRSQKDVYQNCKMFSSEGQFLCNCDKRKILWYLERNLGVLESEKPMVLRLNFEPEIKEKQFPLSLYKESYHMLEKENKCVVCGKDKDYSRFHVVPSLYRTNFPLYLKSHKSEDIVLLCPKCHKKASFQQHQLKEILGKKYNVEVSQINPNQSIATLLHDLRKAALKHKSVQDKSSASFQKSLQGLKSKIEKNEELILERLDKEMSSQLLSPASTEELLEACLSLEELKFSQKEKQNPNGEQIVLAVGEENLEKFIILWRSFFISRMKPQHLPVKWEADKEVEEFFGVTD